MEGEQIVMRFVALSSVAGMLRASPDDMAEILRSERFSDADKAAFADFVLKSKSEVTT
jgi:hypothetical protein